jgi:hypothetical protein
MLGAGGCVGDSVRCGWFSGNVREPVKLLEHVVYTTTWQVLPGHWRGKKRQGGRGANRTRTEKNEEMKEERKLLGHEWDEETKEESHTLFFLSV